MRYGLISNYRRSWSPIGVRTIIDNQQAFSNRYLFSAVSPITGDSFHLIGFEENSSSMVKIFFDEMEKKFKGKHIVIVFDNAPSHRPRIIHERKNITCIFLPPYSPELQPVECSWPLLKEPVANAYFDNLEKLEEVVCERCEWLGKNPKTLKGAVGFSWIREIEDTRD